MWLGPSVSFDISYFHSGVYLVFVEKKKEPRIPTVSEMKIFCQVFLEQICRGGCGTAIGEYWGLQQSEIPHYIYLHPSVFSSTPESDTFPTHLCQQSTLDDDSNCVETLSSKSGRVKIWFKPCDDGTQRRIGKWLQFSENVINQLWRRPLATISCS